MNCMEDRLMVAKSMGGLEEELVNEMRSALYPIRTKAMMRQVYQIAKEAEQGWQFVDSLRGVQRQPDRRRAAWAATEGRRYDEEQREWNTEERRCHKCGEVGHIRRDCAAGITCDVCSQLGHFRRNCPRAPTCGECGKKGHTVQQCYLRSISGRGRTTGEQELELELKKLRAQLGKAEISKDPEKAMLAWEEDEEDEDSQSEFALMATAPRDRRELGL
ncbi:hypothetical protein CLOM_g932 [Closterium sp. NIES-68]|nr:hypothetical protein CLOM_g932 [Closterium sp. NIES-68]